MISCVSDDSLLITLGNEIDPNLTPHIAALCTLIEECREGWLVDLVPSYTTLLVVYDPLRIDFRGARSRLSSLVEKLERQWQQRASVNRSGTLHRIPVYYSAESGPDLEALASTKGLSVAEVIRRHTATEYQVYAVGFLPGFGFLGSVDETIAAPRLDTPRGQVPAGSVGIANRQTAIYPKASPGGWRLIGRSPTRMFDPGQLSLLKVGDRVQFHAISRSEFLDLGGSL